MVFFHDLNEWKKSTFKFFESKSPPFEPENDFTENSVILLCTYISRLTSQKASLELLRCESGKAIVFCLVKFLWV